MKKILIIMLMGCLVLLTACANNIIEGGNESHSTESSLVESTPESTPEETTPVETPEETTPVETPEETTPVETPEETTPESSSNSSGYIDLPMDIF